VNVAAAALAAFILAIVGVLGVLALAIWALDASPKAIRARWGRRAFICPCGHDFVFHDRTGKRVCSARAVVGYDACACKGYAAEIPPPTLAEILERDS